MSQGMDASEKSGREGVSQLLRVFSRPLIELIPLKFSVTKHRRGQALTFIKIGLIQCDNQAINLFNQAAMIVN